ncbi:MAG TPA: ABC transporter permease [bacterium]|nr:ABC transporter permease [bacterium]HOH06954.1 ABC transporter permease [bacterium]
MKGSDLLQFSLDNLRRTRLRTFLTTLGVIIGIGALVAMVSFGTGMQRNITEAFTANDLFTTIRVLPVRMDIEQVMAGNLDGAMSGMQKRTRALNDTAIALIAAMPEVAVVFPEITFPVKIRFGGQETSTTLRSVPVAMGGYTPYDRMGWGGFFSSDSAAEVILSYGLLSRLKLTLDGEDEQARTDSSRVWRRVKADSLIGAEVEVITSVLDLGRMMSGGLAAAGQPSFTEHVTRLRVAGIRPRPHAFSNEQVQGGIVVPLLTGKRMPRFAFNNMWSLLSRGGRPTGSYEALYVRLNHLQDLPAIRKRLQELNFSVFALADQLEEIKRGFLMVDTALGAVGTIALVVAALGIINTMVMSILERTREIGVMKAVGASERQIRTIFFFEAGCIGLMGGMLGVLLGWLVSRLANWIANLWTLRQGGGVGGDIEFFYLPPWLIGGAILFAVGVSLAAGYYPATRAARVNPVEALRHD